MLTDVDELFKIIESNDKAAVLFVTPQFLDAPFIKRLQRDDLIVFSIEHEEISELLQLVRVPQIRLYRKGNEIKSLIGDSILTWHSIFKEV